MAGLSKKAWTGYYAETAPSAPNGTVLTQAPTMMAPAKTEFKFMRASAALDEDRGTRDETYGFVYGARHSEISSKSAFYFESCVYPLMAAIGHSVDSVLLASFAFKHVLTWDDFPRTLAVCQNYDTVEYQSSNVAAEKFGIKVAGDGKVVDFDWSGKGLYPLKKTTPDVANFFTPAISNPVAGYNPTIKLSGAGVASTDIMDFELAFDQKIRLWTPIAGNPDFQKIYYGGRKATISFTARFDADTYFTKWLGITNGITDTLTFDMLGDLLSGTFYNELNISVPSFQFTDMELDKSKEDVVVKVKGECIPTSPTSGPFSLFVTNGIANYTN